MFFASPSATFFGRPVGATTVASPWRLVESGPRECYFEVMGLQSVKGTAMQRGAFKMQWVVGLSVAFLAASGAADVSRCVGGGNLAPGDAGRIEQQLKLLETLGAGFCRVTVHAGDYWPADGRPRPERYDELILQAHRHRVEPMLLFEYYTRWNRPLGGYNKWHAIGRAFAERFGPNSTWLRSKGITDWGVRYYSAINEPMWRSNNPQPIPVNTYVQALEGLADGVHTISGELRVSPGGFQEIPLLRDNPYGPAIAGLYNRRKLFAIDIHRYYDVEYQPMYGSNRNSLQTQFDQVRRKWGISAPIRFYTTEFNFKKREVDEAEAAAGFLTALWDALGVVDDAGQGVSAFAMPWNIFHLDTQDEHYGLTRAYDPWRPTLRGQTLRIVLQLTREMDFMSLDPRKSGLFVLTGAGKKMWVWQNRKGWTDRPGTSFVVTDIPEGVDQIEVYGWEGLRKLVNVPKAHRQVEISDLAPEQTYMFLAGRKDPMPEMAAGDVTETPREGPSWDFSHGPLGVSDNRRFLVHQDGAPFFHLGDTAWELFHRLDREQAKAYLEKRRQQGFTVIQAVVLAELDGLNTPNPYGDRPLIQNDPLRPNEAYFRHVDFIVETARRNGLYIGMLPTWGDKVTKAWGTGPVVFNEKNAHAYGRFLGNRYKDRPNIIWILGGDRVADGREAIWRAMARGIDQGGDTHLKTYHPQGGRSSADWFHADDWLDFNMLQSGHSHLFNANYETIAADYRPIPIKPCLDGEPCYEDHPVGWKPVNGWFNDADVRQAAYWAVFAGAFGHTYGCHDVWQMFAPGREPISSARNAWNDVLDLPGAWDMGHLRALMLSRPVLSRVPDGSLVVEGQGPQADHIEATRGKAYAMVYAPTGKQFAVRLGKISGARVRAWWFDPRTGRALRIGVIENSGARRFDPPGQPHRGNDWVLVLDDADQGFAPPGHTAD